MTTLSFNSDYSSSLLSGFRLQLEEEGIITNPYFIEQFEKAVIEAYVKQPSTNSIKEKTYLLRGANYSEQVYNIYLQGTSLLLEASN